MLDSGSLPERLFGLAVVDGARTVRPGTAVRFSFRTRNVTGSATPPTRVRFVVPPGWSARAEADVALPPVPSGGEHVVFFCAQPDVAGDMTAISRFQAILTFADVQLGSNIVAMSVVGTARFSSPASGLHIEPTADRTLRVRAEIVNEGDAAARDVRIVVPAPPGFRAAPGTTVATADEIAPGESFAFGYDIEAVAPGAAVVRIDDAFVTFTGGRAALATIDPLVLAPLLLPPDVAPVRTATRLDTTIRIANDGWVAARNVRVAIALPSTWRIARGTLLAGNAPAHARREQNAEHGVTIVLPLVPARDAVDIALVASAVRARCDERLTVRCGPHTVEAAIPDPLRRSLELRAHAESPFAVPGTTIPIAVDVWNNGETSETVTIAIDGVPGWDGALEPGSAASIVVRCAVAHDRTDGEIATFSVTATAADGRALAATPVDVRIVDRPWIAIDDVTVDGDGARITVRNAGATTARDVRLDGDVDVRIAALAPGESHAIHIAAGALRHAAVIAAGGTAIAIDWAPRADAVAVDAALIVADSAPAGARLNVRLRCVATAPLETLRVRASVPDGAAPVAASTSVNGFAVIDAADGAPVVFDDGLALHDIPAGTTVEIGWAIVPRTPGMLVLAVDIDANGVPVAVPDARVCIEAGVPFGVRPEALPFHLDAAIVCERVTVAATVTAERPAFVAHLRLDDRRRAAIARVLRGSRGTAIAGHLPAIAVLIASEIGAGPAVRAAYERAADAVRGVYERLFVKLRIPGYDVTPLDWEDAAMRRELSAFWQSAANGDAESDAPESQLWTAIDAAEPVFIAAGLADAPLGGAATVRAIAALLPCEGAADVAPLAAYAGALAGELRTAAARAPETFAAYVATHRSAALDAARDAAIAALDASVPAGAR